MAASTPLMLARDIEVHEQVHFSGASQTLPSDVDVLQRTAAGVLQWTASNGEKVEYGAKARSDGPVAGLRPQRRTAAALRARFIPNKSRPPG